MPEAIKTESEVDDVTMVNASSNPETAPNLPYHYLNGKRVFGVVVSKCMYDYAVWCTCSSKTLPLPVKRCVDKRSKNVGVMVWFQRRNTPALAHAGIAPLLWIHYLRRLRNVSQADHVCRPRRTSRRRLSES